MSTHTTTKSQSPYHNADMFTLLELFEEIEHAQAQEEWNRELLARARITHTVQDTEETSA